MGMSECPVNCPLTHWLGFQHLHGDETFVCPRTEEKARGEESPWDLSWLCDHLLSPPASPLSWGAPDAGLGTWGLVLLCLLLFSFAELGVEPRAPSCPTPPAWSCFSVIHLPATRLQPLVFALGLWRLHWPFLSPVQGPCENRACTGLGKSVVFPSLRNTAFPSGPLEAPGVLADPPGQVPLSRRPAVGTVPTDMAGGCSTAKAGLLPILRLQRTVVGRGNFRA